MTVPRLVAAEQRRFSRADDELVPRIIPATAEDRALHGGQDVALECARACFGQRGVQCIVRQCGGAPVVLNLGGALAAAQMADHIGCVFEPCIREGHAQPVPVAGS